MHSRRKNISSISFRLTKLRELSGHTVGDGRLDSVAESTQVVLGYSVNNISLFKPQELYEKKKL
jgi:hypothetical protein